MATHIKADGTKKKVEPANENVFTLDEIQGYVGGLFQEVRLDRQLMLVHEEGKVRGEVINEVATNMMRSIGSSDWIAGDVLLIDPKEIE